MRFFVAVDATLVMLPLPTLRMLGDSETRSEKLPSSPSPKGDGVLATCSLVTRCFQNSDS